MRDHDGTMKHLRCLEEDEANETIGVFLAADGNNKAQVEKLWGKADEFAKSICTGFVSKREAWQALKTMIMKTLEYPMVALNLTKAQWCYIMTPILKHTLRWAGFEVKFPHALIYGP